MGCLRLLFFRLTILTLASAKPQAAERYALASIFENAAIKAFQRAAGRVPAYRVLLHRAGVDPASVTSIEAFQRLPTFDKKSTFGTFGIDDLCVDGKAGSLASVLTSSGHSGLFAFGLSNHAQAEQAVDQIDQGLDMVFGVRAIPTLLINCLPMGVKVPTRICTLAETSVRPDMVVAIVKAFGSQFGQIVIVGDAAFVKLALELGEQQGIAWKSHRVHIVLGEETLAENARAYLHGLLGRGNCAAEAGIICSSMGIAEVGLNLFFESPPGNALMRLRKMLHDNAQLRKLVLGERAMNWVPSILTYDPNRIFVEFVSDGRLVLTTLGEAERIPLIRYTPGDHAQQVVLPESIRAQLRSAGCDVDLLTQLPIVAIWGRGQSVMAGEHPVHPEAIKEGIYYQPALARLTTANFRLSLESGHARVRIQLAPKVNPDDAIQKQFAQAIQIYAGVFVKVECQAYAAFGSGMTVDYERKFDYLGA